VATTIVAERQYVEAACSGGAGTDVRAKAYALDALPARGDARSRAGDVGASPSRFAGARDDSQHRDRAPRPRHDRTVALAGERQARPPRWRQS